MKIRSLLLLLGMLPTVVWAAPPYIDYDWNNSQESAELCVYSAALIMRELGFTAKQHSGEVVGKKGDYKAVVACIPGRTVYIVSGPSYRQARDYNRQIKQAFYPDL